MAPIAFSRPNFAAGVALAAHIAGTSPLTRALYIARITTGFRISRCLGRTEQISVGASVIGLQLFDQQLVGVPLSHEEVAALNGGWRRPQ